ncbi:MAG: hypothetical protein HQK49_21380 [Oligoflexia bacterium]|nr:hypothetical protein [Oligoflexia bacterium]
MNFYKIILLISLFIINSYVYTEEPADNQNDLAYKEIISIYKNGDYSKVIEKIDSLLMNDNSFKQNYLVTTYYLKGLCYSRIRDFNKAVKNFELALKNNYLKEDIFYEIAQAYYALRKLFISQTFFEISYKKNYMPIHSLYYIAYIRQLSTQYELAIQTYQKIDEKNKNLFQVANYQIAEIYLLQSGEIKDYAVKKNEIKNKIIPQLEKARMINENSFQAKEIVSKIEFLKKRYQLNDNNYVNNKIKLLFQHKNEFDSNVIYQPEQPTARAEHQSSIKHDNIFKISKRLQLNDNYSSTPVLKLNYLYHSLHRNVPEVKRNDTYYINPKIDAARLHTLFNKPATTTLTTDYSYVAQDYYKESKLVFNNRTFSVYLEEKFHLFSTGESKVELKGKFYSARDYLTDYRVFSILLTQNTSIKRDYFLISMLNVDFTDSYKDTFNSQNSYMLKNDILISDLYKSINLNAGFGFTLTDTKKQQSTRGYEQNYNPSISLSKGFFNDFLDVKLNYEYVINISKDKTTYDYRRHVVGIELEIKNY